MEFNSQLPFLVDILKFWCHYTCMNKKRYLYEVFGENGQYTTLFVFMHNGTEWDEYSRYVGHDGKNFTCSVNKVRDTSSLKSLEDEGGFASKRTLNEISEEDAFLLLI